jgi:hypothetical protein
VAALRDADKIGRQIEADEAAAQAVLAGMGRDLPELEPAESIRLLLGPTERVVATRDHALLERRGRRRCSPGTEIIGGTLYLSTERLILQGRGGTQSIALADIDEIAVLGERTIQMTVRTGPGLVVDVAMPRSLRAMIEVIAARMDL